MDGQARDVGARLAFGISNESIPPPFASRLRRSALARMRRRDRTSSPFAYRGGSSDPVTTLSI